MRRIGFLAMALLLGLASSLVACGDDDGGADDEATTTAGGDTDTGDDGAGADTDTGGGAPAGDGSDTVRASIGGGPDAGDHEQAGVNANCSVGLIGDGGFGVQYSDDTVEDGLSSVQVMVPEGDQAAQGSDEFTASVTIGPMFEGTSYHITSGTATVDIDADNPTLTIEGATDDGTEVTAEVACGDVTRM